MILSTYDNKGTDQTVRMRTARMCRLVWAFVVRKPPKTGFLTSRLICEKGTGFSIAVGNGLQASQEIVVGFLKS